MRKLKKGDTVIVISGKYAGTKGNIMKILPPKKPGKKFKNKPPKNANLRVIIEGVNMVKKHVRGNPQQNQPGGIIEREAPMDISKVAIFNPATEKADRVGIKVLEDGKRARFFKSNNEMVDVG